LPPAGLIFFFDLCKHIRPRVARHRGTVRSGVAVPAAVRRARHHPRCQRHAPDGLLALHFVPRATSPLQASISRPPRGGPFLHGDVLAQVEKSLLPPRHEGEGFRAVAAVSDARLTGRRRPPPHSTPPAIDRRRPTLRHRSPPKTAAHKAAPAATSGCSGRVARGGLDPSPPPGSPCNGDATVAPPRVMRASARPPPRLQSTATDGSRSGRSPPSGNRGMRRLLPLHRAGFLRRFRPDAGVPCPRLSPPAPPRPCGVERPPTPQLQRPPPPKFPPSTEARGRRVTGCGRRIRRTPHGAQTTGPPSALRQATDTPKRQGRSPRPAASNPTARPTYQVPTPNRVKCPQIWLIGEMSTYGRGVGCPVDPVVRVDVVALVGDSPTPPCG